MIFDGESYYCSGSNGDDPNFLYRLSREGVLLDSIRQPGFSRYGLKDLEWDGELIWGSGEDSVYAINRDGEVIHRWRGPFNPNNSIAYDSDEGVLWISAVTSEIFAYDREGNNLGRSIDRQGLRLYGLSWYGNDPDSSFLYALNIPGNDSAQINKFNPISGEMSLVHAFPFDSATGFNGAFICRNYDRYQGWLLMTVANIAPASGGDQLQVWQLKPNTEWLTVDPDSGEIPAGGESQIAVQIHTAGEENDWAFELGEYEGEIVFTHNGFGGQTILPVRLNVVEPNNVDKRASEQVDKFELFAAYPNPFNSETQIRIEVPEWKDVSLAIYDLQGREVASLLDRSNNPVNRVVWKAADLPAGIYLARLTAAGESRAIRLVNMK